MTADGRSSEFSANHSDNLHDDGAAFSAAFAEYYARVYSYLRSLTHDHDLALDLTRDTFVQSYRSLPRVDSHKLNARLYAVATRLALSALRRRQVLRWLSAPWRARPTQEVSIPDRERRTEGRAILAEALQRIPPADAACLLLRFQQGLSYAELAEALGVSALTAKLRLARARVALREVYRRFAASEGPVKVAPQCRRVRECLPRYADHDLSDDLDDDAVDEVTRHLGWCEACRRCLALDAQLARGLTELPRPTLDAAAADRLRGQLRTELARQRTRWPFLQRLTETPANTLASAVGMVMLGFLMAVLVVIGEPIIFGSTGPITAFDGTTIARPTPTLAALLAASVPTPAPSATATVAPSLQTLMDVQTATIPTTPPLGSNPEAVTFVDASDGWVLDGDCLQPGPNGCSLLATINGGQTWTEQYHSRLGLPEIFFADPSHGWLLQTECPEGLGRCPTGILATTNGGRRWAQRAVLHDNVSQLQFANARDGWALAQDCAAGENECRPGILKTTDGGSTWTSIGPAGFAPTRLRFVDARHGWVVGCLDPNSARGNGCPRPAILATTDGGKTWDQQFDLPATTAPLDGWLDPINAHQVWLLMSAPDGCDKDGCWGPLYHTADGGKIWTRLQPEYQWQMRNRASPGSGIAVSGTPNGLHFAANGRDGWIPIHPIGGTKQGGIAMTTDGGKTWLRTEIAAGWSLDQIAQATPDSLWLLGKRRSAAGQLPFLVQLPLVPALGGSQGISSHMVWIQHLPARVPTNAVDFVDEKRGFGTGSQSDPNAILQTDDGGKTWKSLGMDGVVDGGGLWTGAGVIHGAQLLDFADPLHGWLVTNAVNSAAIEDPMGSGRMIVPKEILLATDDGGKSWREIFASASQITGIERFDQRNGLIAVAPRSGSDAPTLIETTDGGKTWVEHATFPSFTDPQAISFINPIDGWLVDHPLGDPIQLQATRDAGRRWSTIATDIPAGGALSVASPQDVWYGSYYTIFHTSDDGKIWTATDIALNTWIGTHRLDAISGRVAWLATGNGRLFKTVDGGKTWTEPTCPPVTLRSGRSPC